MAVPANIKDFIAEWERKDAEVWESETTTPNWNKRFKDAGYFPAKVTDAYIKWTWMHGWCNRMIGSKHYAWVGTVFWFEKEEDAIFFILNWA